MGGFNVGLVGYCRQREGGKGNRKMVKRNRMHYQIVGKQFKVTEATPNLCSESFFDRIYIGNND